MSMRENVVSELRTCFKGLSATASELADHTGARLDSLSSVLTKMTKDGTLKRRATGPRGGYKYSLRKR